MASPRTAKTTPSGRAATRAELFRPKRGREDSQAEEGEHVPVGRRLVVDREKEVKRKDRRAEPKKKQRFEVLARPAPAANHSPGEAKKQDRRIDQEVFHNKFHELARMNADDALHVGE